MGAVAATFAANLAAREMVNEVNRRSPGGRRFHPWFFLSENFWQVRREYRELCPEGRLVGRLRLLGALAFLLWICLVLAFAPYMQSSLR